MGGNDSEIIQQIKNEKDILSIARLLHHLVYQKGNRIVDVAKSLGRKPSYICHILRLFHLPDIVLDGYYSKLITLSHLFILSRIKDKDKLMKTYETLLSGNYSVQQTEQIVREALHEIKTIGTPLNKKDILSYTDALNKTFPHLKIEIIQTRIKGKIIMEIKGSREKSTLVFGQLLAKLTK